MPNDLNLEKLVLKGYFERSEETKEREKKDLENSGQITTEMKKILDFKNQKFSFEVNMLYFNSDSGIFIARGDDLLGESVIYGKIEYKKRMEFKKIYLVGKPRHKFPVRGISSLDYSGFMGVSGKKISCTGIWETYRNSPENGIWVLNSEF